MDHTTHMPDEFDRALGALDGLPGTMQTKPAIKQLVTPLLGTSATYIVRTVRQQEGHSDKTSRARFTIFLQCIASNQPPVKIVLPPAVTDLIQAQRDRLTGQARKQTARQAAQTRKDRGIVSFQKKKAGV